MKNTPNDNLILRAAIWFFIFVAGVAFAWQMTEPEGEANGIHRAKQAIGVTR